jgi:hypothetical protein
VAQRLSWFTAALRSIQAAEGLCNQNFPDYKVMKPGLHRLQLTRAPFSAAR